MSIKVRQFSDTSLTLDMDMGGTYVGSYVPCRDVCGPDGCIRVIDWEAQITLRDKYNRCVARTKVRNLPIPVVHALARSIRIGDVRLRPKFNY